MMEPPLSRFLMQPNGIYRRSSWFSPQKLTEMVVMSLWQSVVVIDGSDSSFLAPIPQVT